MKGIPFISRARYKLANTSNNGEKVQKSTEIDKKVPQNKAKTGHSVQNTYGNPDGSKNGSMLLRLEPIIEILQAAVWTGMLADEKPVSVMLIAEQESAKTEALKYFRGTRTIRYVSDLTSRGLLPYRSDIKDNKLRHLCLLDLVRLLAHGRGVSERTIQTIASLMEEGESETSDAGGRESWGADFPRIGCLMAITPRFFKAKKGKWRQTGFLTRFVPISFCYSEDTVHQIHHQIAMGQGLPAPHPEVIPPVAYQISLPREFASILSRTSEELGKKMRTYGFRYHRILRALAKARARTEKRGVVNIDDVNKVLEWSRFFTDKEIML